MKDHFEKYLADSKWQFYENGWYPDLQNIRETIFSLGNGYVGSRAILEECPQGSQPGTFFAGLYEGTRSLVPELINAPNPIDLRISSSGEKLGAVAMDVLSHKRILDIYKGILLRRTVYSTARKKRIDYQSMRFFSMNDKNVALMQVYLTSLDADVVLTVTTNIDASVVNMGLVTEGRKKHSRIIESSVNSSVNHLIAKTKEKNVLMAYASKFIVKKGRKIIPFKGWTFDLKLKKGETACLTNYLSFNFSGKLSQDRLREIAVKSVIKSSKKGLDKLLTEHTKAWKKRWKYSNIEIIGDHEIERVVRFNIYHLLSAACHKYKDVSIGAKALTGEGYRGHIFWDSEIFCLPFYIYTKPGIAKNLLLYRYNRLAAARKIAKEKGYEGAMFPWESADTGEETTPSWYKDEKGKIQKVLTGELECHVTADIAYAVSNYFNVTNDTDFMLKYGLEIIFEAARFWASRGKYDKRRKKFAINNVIGPDEFHENVNNNAYTNMLAHWTLRKASRFHKSFTKSHPKGLKKIAAKIDLKPGEPKKWLQISSKICLSYDKKNEIIEQFDGFLKRRKLPLPELNAHSLPVNPQAKDLNATQYVKQADVIMIMFLLSDLFNGKKKRDNYEFYEKRTLHRSSLSASIHSAMASEIGERNKAWKYFITSAYTDLKNIYENTGSGIHVASMGGTWQAFIHGFAGVRIRKGILSINPQLPHKWKRIKANIMYRGEEISLDLGHKDIAVFLRSKRKKLRLPVTVYRHANKLMPNKRIIFAKKR